MNKSNAVVLDDPCGLYSMILYTNTTKAEGEFKLKIWILNRNAEVIQ